MKTLQLDFYVPAKQSDALSSATYNLFKFLLRRSLCCEFNCHSYFSPIPWEIGTFEFSVEIFVLGSS